MSATASLALLLFVSAQVQGHDGVDLGPPLHDALPLNAWPLLLADDDSVAYGDNGRVVCRTAAGAVGEVHYDPLAPTPEYYGGHGAVAGARGSELYTAAWGLQAYPTSGLPSPSPGFALFRASCGETPVKLYASEEQLPPEIDPYFRGAAPVDDERLYLPTEDGLWAIALAGDAGAAPFADRATLQAALDAATTNPYPWTDGPPLNPFGIHGAASTPSGVVLQLVEPLGSGDLAWWLARVGTDGAVEVIGTPDELRPLEVNSGTTMVWDASLELLVFVCARGLCFVDESGAALAQPVTPWLSFFIGPDTSVAPVVSTLVAGASTPATFVEGAAHRVRFAPARADMDRDGLAHDDELALGTSPWFSDSDDDGITDGAEVRFFASDALSAQSPAPRTMTGTRYAPSTMFAHWQLPRDRLVFVNGYDVSGVSPAAICYPVEGETERPCLDGEGTPIRDESFVPGVRFTADFEAAIEDGVLTDLTTGGSAPIDGVEVPGRLIAGFGKTTFETFDEGIVTVRRYNEDGAFDVIDPRRTSCPLLGSPDEEATRCQDPSEELRDVYYSSFAGYHRPTRSTLFLMHTYTRGAFLVAINDTRAERILHLSRFGGRELQLATAPDGETLLTLHGEDQADNGVAVVDAHLRLVSPEHARGLLVPRAGPWFRDGFLTTMGIPEYVMPAPSGDTGGCTPPGADGVSLCAFSPSFTLTAELKTRVVPQEWVPVPELLEPGEAVFFAKEGTALVGDQADDWALWRLTRAGGAHRWLDLADVAALLDDAGRASVAEAPLGAVTYLGVRADGRRVCVVEDSGRLFELHLDPAPSTFALISDDGVRACGYDGEELVRLAGEGGRHLVGADGVARQTSVIDGSGMTPIPGGFLVWSSAGSAACVRGDEVTVANGLYRAAAFSHGRVTYVDDKAHGYVAPVERVCGGSGPREALTHFTFTEHPRSLLALISTAGAVTWESTADRFHVALNHEGMVLFAAERVRPVGGDGNPTFLDHDRLWRLAPSFTPEDASNRIEALDPRRREAALLTTATFHAERITALAGVPTDEDLVDGWEYLGRERPPPHVVSTPPPDEEPPLVVPWEDELGESCACTTTNPGAAPFALGVLTLWFGWRRRRSRW